MSPESILKDVQMKQGNVIFLTGAGLSTDSGIPTFRGPEGYWTIGSKNYMPTEMATQEMFNRYPEKVWDWYLYRFGVCARAKPNKGHQHIVDFEQKWKDRFVLVSKNIDGLHQEAGNSLERSFYIHGNAAFFRCAASCTKELRILPTEIWYEGKPEMNAATKHQLTCPNCGAWMRPHVLWFDESYDEDYYSFETVLNKTERADLVFLIGTSGATTLPVYVVQYARAAGAYLVEINPNETNFTDVVKEYSKGLVQRGTASELLGEWMNYFSSSKYNL